MRPLAILILGLSSLLPLPATARPASAAAGFSEARLSRVDAVIESAIRRGEMPGAVLLVGRRDHVVYRKAYGLRALLPEKEPMTVDTVFDMASLTKALATATSVMTLVERGSIRLSDPVVAYLPEFGAGGGERDQVTVEMLLVHRAGLPPDDPMSLYSGTPAEIFARKHARPLAGRPGARFVYSDAGYEVLAELLRKVSGQALDAYAEEHVFGPLGMRDTHFRPLGKVSPIPVSRVAPTERRAGTFARGEVHDPRAYALGGVAGHAGLFSTADDVSRFARALLAGGGAFLSPAGVAALTRPRAYGDGDLRALGFDVETRFSTPRGDVFPPGSFGHTGWTGTCLWIDPTSGVYFVLLANRNHPDESGNVIPLRSKVANVVAAAIADVPVEAWRAAAEAVATMTACGGPATPVTAPPPESRRFPADVRAGVDVLAASGFTAIAGRRVGLVTNQTGLARDGRSTIDVLASAEAKAKGVTLVRLFSPEHGIRGLLDEKVADGRDERTGLPVRSLYGESRRPAPADLADLDAVVVDLQDAGCRFYTYLTTLGYVMEEAAKARVEVVVLDRPNPIRADVVEGPPADDDRLSFTAYHAIPLRPGMTIGELARLFNAERRIGADLTVVAMTGYARGLWYDETGLSWVSPSPNLRSVNAAALYPGVALLETTNVSVGRGTDAPFELFGAPWLDGPRLARYLSSQKLPGVRFVATRFTPAASTFAGKSCGGVRISVVDRGAVQPVALGLEIAAALRDLHPADWDRRRFGELLANGAALTRFERGDSPGSVAATWAPSLMEFERRREAFLLYPP